MIQRTETISILLKLNKKEADRYKKEIREILGSEQSTILEKGDKLFLTYDFYIHYIGRIVEKLEAVNRLVSDPEVIAECSMEELEYGRSVIRDLFKQIEQTTERLNETI